MWKYLALSLSIGALLVPATAARSGLPVLTGEVLRPSAEEWCPEGAQPSPANDCITPPVLLHSPTPAYPELALKGRITGVVSLEAVVAESGRVVDVKVLRPNRVFTDAAVAAVRQRTYQPALRRGEPVATCFPVIVRFDLVPPAGRPKLGPGSGASEVLTVVAYDAKAGTAITEQRYAPRRDTSRTGK